ncbi:hypothetical protein DIU38_024665 [Mucilaginibacter sp. P4]|uniref:hypothetical protein n=1 Tax=Mucilaginibacter sp. P4 TaxID=3383180 RepID=UPI0011EC3102|nr:hypothetical protein [Mucilaginibacter gossypii]QEM19091.1 hypothetical protein DIU38_024665 [Mucilaginibacter gossypii]
MRKFLILLIFCVNFSQVVAQNQKIILKRVVGNKRGAYQVPPSPEDATPLSIPDSMKFTYFKYYYTFPWTAEEVYRRYKNGVYTQDRYNKVMKSVTSQSVDTTLLESRIKEFDSFKVHIIAGVDITGNRVFLIDANGDNKIEPSEIITYTREIADSLRKNIHAKELMQNIALLKKVIEAKFELLIFKYCRYLILAHSRVSETALPVSAYSGMNIGRAIPNKGKAGVVFCRAPDL